LAAALAVGEGPTASIPFARIIFWHAAMTLCIQGSRGRSARQALELGGHALLKLGALGRREGSQVVPAAQSHGGRFAGEAA
jgi:hypothetical protein